jgi:hypothetical protein
VCGQRHGLKWNCQQDRADRNGRAVAVLAIWCAMLFLALLCK